jgi:hypothetical protein
VADDELRGRESRAKPELGLWPSPRSACSAFCLLRRRPAQSGCCAAGRENLVADELRGRGGESRAKPELRLRTRSPPPEGGVRVVPDPLALLSAFCAAGQPAQRCGCCAAGRENLVADEEPRGRESRAKTELRLRTRPPPPREEGVVPDLLAQLSAYCAAGQPPAGAAPQAEKIWWPTS